jgi:hypothetical protein
MTAAKDAAPGLTVEELDEYEAGFAVLEAEGASGEEFDDMKRLIAYARDALFLPIDDVRDVARRAIRIRNSILQREAA